jgi:hypothetical protein
MQSMKKINVKTAFLVMVALICLRTSAQNTSEKIKVFLDCRVGCDFNFIRTEITIVDFVKDQPSAELQVLVTAQGVGSGGTQYQMDFYGQSQLQPHRKNVQPFCIT